MSEHVWRGGPAPMIVPALVDALVLRHAASRPEAVAVVDERAGRSATYGQLADGSARVAGGLAARGIGRGDVVAIVAPNGLEHVLALLGTLRAGAAVASANPMLTAAELAYRLAPARPALAIAAEPATAAVREALGDVPMVASVDALLGAPAAPAGERSPEDLAYLFSSTGTSGLPKVAAHRHSGATAFLQMFAANPVMAFRETDSALVIVPFAHLYGTAILTHALHCGARVVVPAMEGFDVDVFLRALQDHRVTVCPLSPPAAQLLARHPAVDRFDLGAVRFLNTGAAPCPPGLEAAVEARIGCRVADTWGMTECWCPAPPADPIVHGSCGRLAPGHEARVVDPASGAGLRPGEVGELWLRGPQVMRGYVGEEAEGSPDAGGWLHTGDLCRLDDEGNLFYVDRLKDLIKVGGYSVAPAEVEAAVVTHPAVGDAAVVGRDDPHEGQVPVAFVTLRAPATAAELDAWVATRLAPWKRPVEFVVVEALPRHPTGKLLRAQLAVQRQPVTR